MRLVLISLMMIPLVMGCGKEAEDNMIIYSRATIVSPLLGFASFYGAPRASAARGINR